MTITGAHTDGEYLSHVKIENSWGEDIGDKGYYTASADWLLKYGQAFVINKKHLTKSQKDIYENEKKRIRIDKDHFLAD